VQPLSITSTDAEPPSNNIDDDPIELIALEQARFEQGDSPTDRRIRSNGHIDALEDLWITAF
jgi:hypothetical protein